MIDPKQTRGFLNNNPGNMDRGTDPWQGEIRDVALCRNDMQRQELTIGRFCVFIDAAHGVRAMVFNLRAYRDRLGCRTVNDFIRRWAPPNENNTAGYVLRVCEAIAADPNTPIDIEVRRNMRGLVQAIIGVECAGNPYDGTEIDDGLNLAGVAA